ncbi:Phosphoribosylaminoimidazole carboxylase catalytic subunit (EC [Lentimonas sp. CC10]|nr:Phosphoribosylaminoimidazole carboxylase catalytic subunit (EC [Lentimonas sp. CC10]
MGDGLQCSNSAKEPALQRLNSLQESASLSGMEANANNAVVGIIMGSHSDWSTMGEAAALLKQLEIPFETKIVSAHRTPGLLYTYAETAEARGIQIIIAGAGGAAHLPGMTAAMTHLPVLGVPVQSKALSGQDSLLSIVQMPAGIPVMTLAIGVAGAKNAALSAASILSLNDADVRDRLKAFRENQTNTVLSMELPEA